MNIVIQQRTTKPKVNVGDVLVTQGGTRILLVESETGKVLALDLDSNTLLKRVYEDVEDFLKNFSFSYTVYSANDIELIVKGAGEKWR